MAGQVNPDILTKGINDVRTVSGNIQTNGLTSEKLITAIKALETVQVGIGGGPRTPPGPSPSRPSPPSGSPPNKGATRKPSISMEELIKMQMPGGGTFKNLRQTLAAAKGPQKTSSQLAQETLKGNIYQQKVRNIYQQQANIAESKAREAAGLPLLLKQGGGRRRTAHRNQKRRRASTRKQSRRA